MYNLRSKTSVHNIQQVLARLSAANAYMTHYKYLGVPLSIDGTLIKRGAVISVNPLGAMVVSGVQISPSREQQALLQSNLQRME